MNKLAAFNLKRGIWPWSKGIYSEFPDHYKRSVIERFTKQPQPVHYLEEPKWKIVPETGERIRNQTVPVPLIIPKEAHEGLWGGEGIIRGFIKRSQFTRRQPYYWRPHLVKQVLHSEILDRWMPIPVTYRTLELIDKHFGFDNYILQTHEVDLQSRLGMKLKREMILTLSRKSMYPNDPEKREEVYQKYKQFIIPEDQAEWLGLSFSEAIKKLRDERAKEKDLNSQPLKEGFLRDLEVKLRVEEEEEEAAKRESWIGGMFGSKSTTDQDKKS